MSNERTIEYYMRQIHDLVARYNAVSENGELDETAEASAVELLVEARTVMQEALSLGFHNEELLELHVDLAINLSWYFFKKALATEEYTQSFIEPEEFAQRWSEPENLVLLDESQLQEYEIGEETRRFLTQVGLPSEINPLGSFLGDEQVGRLWDVWGLDEEETTYAKEDFSNYLLIGSDGYGNPICLDEENNDIVVVLDQGYGFQAVTFVNSSVQQLAECLLVYQSVMDKDGENGEDPSAEDAMASEDLIAWAEKEILRIDSRAMSRECFWQNELDGLRQE